MPNYVKIRMVGADMEALKKAIVNEDGNVDFNMLIPRPKDLSISSGSMSYNELPGEHIEAHQRINFGMIANYNGTITQDDFVAKCLENEDLTKLIHETYFERNNYEKALEYMQDYIKGFFNLQRHGYIDWYRWSIDKWGTKWNAADSVVTDDYIEFETAWNLPTPICEEIARKVTPIRVVYADEDKGYNCGLVDFYVDEQTGEIVEDEIMSESKELAYDTWGYGSVPAYDEEWEEIEDENDPRVIEANKDFFTIQEQINGLMTSKCLVEDLRLSKEVSD